MATDNSFISFTFDDKPLEEFGLKVVSGGSRYTLPSYPNFTDELTVVPGRIGQQYWGTTIEDGAIEFNLATDGMTGRQYENFKRHFTLNKFGKLILSEAPYKYCSVKISASPRFDVIPFQGYDTINGIKYETTLYKGEGSISFILINPLWLGSYNYLSHNPTDSNYKRNFWALESGMPWPADLTSTPSIVSSLDKRTIVAKNAIYEPSTNTFVTNTGQVNLSTTAGSLQVYNAGNFEAYPVYGLTLTPQTNSYRYIVLPYNEHSTTPYPYNRVMLRRGNYSFEFKFTLPRLLYSINNVMSIVDEYANLYDSKDILIARFRDSIDHRIIREQAIGYARAITPTTTVNNFKDQILTIIKVGGNYSPTSFGFDSQKGISTMSIVLTLNRFNATMDTYEYNIISENVSDMVMSPYMSILGGFGIQNNGKIDGAIDIFADYAFSSFSLAFQNTYI